MRFTKMHGIGNDYIYINGFVERVENPGALAVAMSLPHYGVGSDGLILILPSEKADFRMRMFNSDGSEGTMCGNGARCVGKYVHDHGMTDKTNITLETGGGIRQLMLNLTKGSVDSVCVDMGAPQALKVLEDWTLISMGNPHAARFIREDPFLWTAFEEEGPKRCVEFDANIEFARVMARDLIKMRVYERGSGETFACGTGACAVLVAAQTAGLTDRRARVVLRGGELLIDWRASDGHVLMTGGAETVFEGEWKQSIKE